MESELDRYIQSQPWHYRLARKSRLAYFFIGKYGFVRYGFAEFWLRVWWRIKHGFWVSDLYGLDESLAEWFSPRLKHLAYCRDGCPCYYGMTPEQVKEEEENPNTHSPDFDKWTIDLLKAAESMDNFLFWARGGLDCEDDATEERKASLAKYNFDKEQEARERYAKTLHWVADNIGGLWT